MTPASGNPPDRAPFVCMIQHYRLSRPVESLCDSALRKPVTAEEQPGRATQSVSVAVLPGASRLADFRWLESMDSERASYRQDDGRACRKRGCLGDAVMPDPHKDIVSISCRNSIMERT